MSDNTPAGGLAADQHPFVPVFAKKPPAPVTDEAIEAKIAKLLDTSDQLPQQQQNVSTEVHSHHATAEPPSHATRPVHDSQVHNRRAPPRSTAAPEAASAPSHLDTALQFFQSLHSLGLTGATSGPKHWTVSFMPLLLVLLALLQASGTLYTLHAVHGDAWLGVLRSMLSGTEPAQDQLPVYSCMFDCFNSHGLQSLFWPFLAFEFAMYTVRRTAVGSVRVLLFESCLHSCTCVTT